MSTTRPNNSKAGSNGQHNLSLDGVERMGPRLEIVDEFIQPFSGGVERRGPRLIMANKLNNLPPDGVERKGPRLELQYEQSEAGSNDQYDNLINNDNNQIEYDSLLYDEREVRKDLNKLFGVPSSAQSSRVETDIFEQYKEKLWLHGSKPNPEHSVNMIKTIAKCGSNKQGTYIPSVPVFPIEIHKITNKTKRDEVVNTITVMQMLCDHGIILYMHSVSRKKALQYYRNFIRSGIIKNPYKPTIKGTRLARQLHKDFRRHLVTFFPEFAKRFRLAELQGGYEIAALAVGTIGTYTTSSPYPILASLLGVAGLETMKQIKTQIITELKPLLNATQNTMETATNVTKKIETRIEPVLDDLATAVSTTSTLSATLKYAVNWVFEKIAQLRDQLTHLEPILRDLFMAAQTALVLVMVLRIMGDVMQLGKRVLQAMFGITMPDVATLEGPNCYITTILAMAFAGVTDPISAVKSYNAIKGVAGTIDDIATEAGFRAFVNTVVTYIGGKPLFEIHLGVDDAIQEWLDRTTLLLSHSPDEVIDNPQLSREVIDCCQSGLCMRTDPMLRNASQFKQKAFHSTLADMKKLFNNVIGTSALINDRVPPTNIMLEGRPGQGKSLIEEFLLSYIVKITTGEILDKSNESKHIYCKDPQSPFWEKLTAQSVYVYREFLNCKLPDVNLALSAAVLVLSDGSRCPLNTAFGNKGSVFGAPTFQVFNTNNSALENTGLDSPDALKRRMSFYLEVKAVDTLPTDKSSITLADLDRCFTFKQRKITVTRRGKAIHALSPFLHGNRIVRFSTLLSAIAKHHNYMKEQTNSLRVAVRNFAQGQHCSAPSPIPFCPAIHADEKARSVVPDVIKNKKALAVPECDQCLEPLSSYMALYSTTTLSEVYIQDGVALGVAGWLAYELYVLKDDSDFHQTVSDIDPELCVLIDSAGSDYTVEVQHEAIDHFYRDMPNPHDEKLLHVLVDNNWGISQEKYKEYCVVEQEDTTEFEARDIPSPAPDIDVDTSGYDTSVTEQVPTSAPLGLIARILSTFKPTEVEECETCTPEERGDFNPYFSEDKHGDFLQLKPWQAPQVNLPTLGASIIQSVMGTGPTLEDPIGVIDFEKVPTVEIQNLSKLFDVMYSSSEPARGYFNVAKQVDLTVSGSYLRLAKYENNAWSFYHRNRRDTYRTNTYTEVYRTLRTYDGEYLVTEKEMRFLAQCNEAIFSTYQNNGHGVYEVLHFMAATSQSVVGLSNISFRQISSNSFCGHIARTAVDWIRSNPFKATLAVACLSGAIALGTYFIETKIRPAAAVAFLQSPNRSGVGIKPQIAKPPPLKPKPFKYAKKQGGAKNDHNMIANMRWAKVWNGDGSALEFRVLVINARTVVLLKHFLERDWQCIDFCLNMSTTSGIRYKKRDNYDIVENGELVIMYLYGLELPAAKNILPRVQLRKSCGSVNIVERVTPRYDKNEGIMNVERQSDLGCRYERDLILDTSTGQPLEIPHAYNYNINHSQSGDCCSVLFNWDKPNAPIVGIHTAMFSGQAIAITLYRELFLTYDEVFAKRTPTLPTKLPTFIDERTHAEIHTVKAPQDALLVAKLERAFFTVNKTKITESPLQTCEPIDEVPENMFHNLPYGDVSKCVKFDRTNVISNPDEYMRKALTYDCTKGIAPPPPRKGLEPYSIERAVSSMDSSTSAGLEHLGTNIKSRHQVWKKDTTTGEVIAIRQETRDNVENYIASCATDTPEATVALYVEKDEVVPLTKTRKRVFCILPLYQLISMLMWFGPLIDFQKQRYWETMSGIGLRPMSSRWAAIHDRVSKYHMNFQDDLKSMDITIKGWLRHYFFKWLLQYYKFVPGSVNYRTLWGMVCSVTQPLYIVGKAIIQTDGSNCSGSIITGFFNVFVRAFTSAAVFYYLQLHQFGHVRYSFREFVYAIFYGDDGIQATSRFIANFYRPFTITPIMREFFGLIHTTRDGSEIVSYNDAVHTHDDLQFLSRMFVKDGHITKCPLLKTSFYKCLQWITRSATATKQEVLQSIARTITFEAALHGEEFYNDFVRKYEHRFIKCGVNHRFPDYKIVERDTYALYYGDDSVPVDYPIFSHHAV